VATRPRPSGGALSPFRGASRKDRRARRSARNSEPVTRVRWFGFEHRREPLAPREAFRGRLVRSSLLAFAIISVSLVMGMVGYHVFGRLDSWVDCLYNASMILGGMGPAAELHTNAGKVFASVYALYSGVTLLTSVGVLMAPAVHRMLHQFHIETEEEDETR
jgi:hypothetical protein